MFSTSFKERLQKWIDGERSLAREFDYGVERNEICAKVAQELKDGFYVNLGIGVTLSPQTMYLVISKWFYKANGRLVLVLSPMRAMRIATSSTRVNRRLQPYRVQTV